MVIKLLSEFSFVLSLVKIMHLIQFMLLSSASLPLLARCNEIASMPHSYSRVNWGVVFNKVGTILNGIAKYRHTFAVAIPVMDYTPLQLMPCDSDELKLAHCEAINILVNEVNMGYENEFALMKQNVANVLAVIGEIDETGGGGRRKKRDTTSSSSSPHLSPDFCQDGSQDAGGGGLLATLGKIGSDIFGLPTYDDIRIVDKHICQLADTVDLNRREILKSNERLSSVSAALNNRISSLQHGLANMNERISETQDRLVEVTRTMVDDLNELSNRMSFIEATQEAMYLFIANLERFQNAASQHLTYAATWLYGVNKLLEGYVPQELIMVDDIQSVLDHVQNVVLPKNPQLRLVHTNPSFYYQVRSTAFTRTTNYVFITLTVPLRSVGGILAVYRVDRTHISTAEHHTSSTRIANLPDFFAVTPSDLAYYTELSLAHYSSCRGEGIRVCPTERGLRASNSLTCAAAIFYDRTTEISKHCEIHFEERVMPSEVVKLRDMEYLVHSEYSGPDETWTLHCPYASPEPGSSSGQGHLQSIASCNTCIIQLPCGCSLDGGTFLIPVQLTGCTVHEELGFPEVTKLFPINLPVLTSLYSAEDILHMHGSTVHTEPSHSDLLPTDFLLNVTKSDWAGVVAKDEKYKVDFKKLISRHKKESVAYADKAEYYLKKATDFYDLNMAHIKDLEKQFGGELYHNFLNPSAIVGGTSTFWVVAVISLSMSVYNCYRGRGR